MVARILNLAGLYLGEPADLMGAIDGNTDTLWEHREFVVVNDALLNELGAGWDHPVDVPPGWMTRSQLAPIRARASELLARFKGRARWGWKDPRNSLTLPFWRAVAGRVKVVLCVRHPLEVSLSLRARNYFSEAHSLHLWQVYNAHALKATAPVDRVVTHYDAYFADPRAELKRVLTFTGLDASPAVLDAGAAAIAGRLRHHRLASDHLDAAQLAPDLADLYDRLRLEAGLSPGGRRRVGRRSDRSRSRASRRAASQRPAPRVNAFVMDLVRERDDLRAAVAAKDTALAVKEAAITLRELSYRELHAEVQRLRHELEQERHKPARRPDPAVEAEHNNRDRLKRRLYDLLDDTIPRGATVLMVSKGDDALLHLNGRNVWHFPRTEDGLWNGHPADSRDAIAHLDAIRQRDRLYLVFPPNAFWWLEYYADFKSHLDASARVIANEPETAIVFALPAIGR